MRTSSGLIVALCVAGAVSLGARSGIAFVDLTAGKTLSTSDRDGAHADKVKFAWRSDPALLTLPESPLCPTSSSIQLLTDAGTLPVVPLDCATWVVAGTKFLYRETLPSGGKMLVKLGAGGLKVRLTGQPYGDAPVVGPVAFVETRLRVGSTEFCGRWAQPPGEVRTNDAAKVRIKGPTAGCAAACGNAIVEAGEACDDGNAVDGDGCDGNCTATACGNGIATMGEACDDGNAATGDGCRPDCTVEACGDGIEDPGEACDDGNTSAGDCCSPACAFEGAGSPCASDLNPCTDDVCDGTGTCQHTPNGDPCNDLDGCTIGDTCAGGVCGGTLRAPWFNEIDYDDFFGSLDDRDEFIEIAGPAGTDLSNFRIVHVEGGTATNCLTPNVAPLPAAGEAHMILTIPPGTVLADDTGTGVGFYVACFTNTSTNVVNLPACDDVLAAPRLDSNLMNGDLLNRNPLVACADGVALLDPGDAVVDAVSWEGIVPNVGTYGSLFYASPPYSIPRDEGWLPGVSIEKTSSTLERGQSAAEWIDPSENPMCVDQGGTAPPPACPSLTRSPGEANSQQALECGSPSGAFLE